LAATIEDEARQHGNKRRDRSGETQTSGDQSNSPADLKITRLSGSAMKDSELSMTAKNIKVITANGTLHSADR